MARNRKKGRGGRKSRQGGGRLNKQEKEAQLADSMAKIHELFIKMEDEFKGCTISGVAIDSNTGAVCIHVEEHNKVLMFYASDFSIGEHSGKLSDMLLNAGFVVPDVILESWNEGIIDMVNTYVQAVVAGTEAPDTVDPDKITALLGPYHKPDEAAVLVEKLRQQIEDRKVARKAEGEEEALEAANVETDSETEQAAAEA